MLDPAATGVFEGPPAVGAAAINAFAGLLAGPDADADVSDAERIDRITALENLKDAAAAAQAKASAALDASIRVGRAAAGVPKDRCGRGIAKQIGLARRQSPHRGGLLLGVAKALVNEMPHTLKALETGRLNERRASILVSETLCLRREDRARVDEELAGNQTRLNGLGDKALTAEAKRMAYRLDPHSVVNRAAKAEADRHVSARPEPDTMVSVRTLLPVVQGVAVMAALNREADRLRNAGDPRSRGQAMADTVFERLTGASTADPARTEIQLVMTDRALLQGDSEPVWLTGYGIVPAQYARDLIRLPYTPPAKTGPPGAEQKAPPAGTEPGWKTARDEARQARMKTLRVGGVEDVWIRRLFTAPGTGQLLGMDSKARKFPDGLRRMIMARDASCTGPWCDAPIRHIDHIVAWSEGGETTLSNGRGLCEECNYAHEAEGWSARTVGGPAHSVATTTPTGHVYTSTAPPLPGASTPEPEWHERTPSDQPERQTREAWETGEAGVGHVAGRLTGKMERRRAQRRRRARLMSRPHTLQASG
ncbi:HNH endonuclease [Arthrobacter sulfonylureivorans]|uniref:HNH endonuclease n=1 Tax=Arthrobacter sulfonylureivorans TaxID=2486855 RepID=A0ABY3W9A0_9MICC|nr:HNH endonuclease signature motif containing protein [Arthrobacter sulfonylureivorans]UNK45158.1 HNH endonuclease [Arthrobacter sulfonylureivorans]